MTALVVGLTVAVALLAVLVAGLLRSNAEVLRALHLLGVDLDPSGPGGEPGSGREVSLPAPGVRPTPARPDATDVIDIAGVTPRGETVSFAVSGVQHDTLAAFLTSGCSTCRGFWSDFSHGSPDVPGGARLVVVTRGPSGESPGTVAGLAGRAQVVMSDEAWEHYDIPYAPYFVYISGPQGKVVGEGVAARWEEVKTLVGNAVADGTTTPRTQKSRSRADQERDDAVDRQLRAAGIEPGDPRLHPTAISDGGKWR
jgi:predicted small secreted protein